ncbi:hypothetical protein O4160_25530 [Rhodococcus sp. IEGM 1401]|jgi:hypothetical protein|uniref:Unannotated protein n=1 Tax=freshwater metagenome TaxID=449393 RepID=A0A6J7IFG9_9ZZZZ|nr:MULTISPECIES: hypothetical protein [Rhodococcus]MSX08484.1 hypothetical protein [Actinomycetota bacterium]MBJ7325587.1 hypothetical protein [Rhodococcus sp. (in: high G+C Gram-positive bacteria)]MCJ0895383.1 hypothetical protein [Rhodococcus sp. ARC_M5]MCJ0980967.1 hypothetical protein [Rhodococcus sp. ARC_M12]MCX6491233.1 hypothetical protein [Rhodococcus sp. (in: high G+C Gram-positive bacteria)]
MVVRQQTRQTRQGRPASHFDTVWVPAEYHFALRDGRGVGFTYIEGDIVRGTSRL